MEKKSLYVIDKENIVTDPSYIVYVDEPRNCPFRRYINGWHRCSLNLDIGCDVESTSPVNCPLADKCVIVK